jgi:RNA polymerase sigma-70 factor (ECF subfamily)
VPRALTDELARARAGDPTATETLARSACTSALRTASAIMRSREEAGDVAQDVAVDVLRSLHKLRDPQAFDAWVHRITVRHALRALRDRRAAGRNEVPLGLLGEPDHPAAPEIDHAGMLANRQALAAAIAELPPRQRVALALRYVHDLGDEQIADAMGCRRGTAGALLSRARSALRRNPLLKELRVAAAKGDI